MIEVAFGIWNQKTIFFLESKTFKHFFESPGHLGGISLPFEMNRKLQNKCAFGQPKLNNLLILSNFAHYFICIYSILLLESLLNTVMKGSRLTFSHFEAFLFFEKEKASSIQSKATNKWIWKVNEICLKNMDGKLLFCWIRTWQF